MRLASVVPVPVVSLGTLALVTIALADPTVTADAPPTAEIASEEPIEINANHDSIDRSVWEGTYVCAQGLASMRLTLDVNQAGAATLRYDFGPAPSNPVIPKTGAFILTGSVTYANGGFTGELQPQYWIDQPEGYLMLPLSIASTDGTTLTGRIHYESCTEFAATRLD